MQVLTTDVAIVGGGAAGCYAALTLHRAGVESVIICKGLVGKSGASIFAGNLVLSGRALGNTEEQARNTAEFLIKYHNQFLIDQHWARRCGQWIESVYYPELEEAGLYLRRDEQGNMVTSPGKIRSVAANVQGNSGVPFMDLRRKQIIKAQIPRLEETAVTALLRKRDGSVGGVFALDILTGEYVVVLARAVILATGYSDRLHARSTGTREMSGDGIAMAWRVGATHGEPRNAMVAHQRHRRSAVLAAHAGLSEPDARLGQVGAHGELGRRGILQPAAGRSARLWALHGSAQGAGKAGSRRESALRRRLFRRLRSLRSRARSKPTRPTASPSVSSACPSRGAARNRGHRALPAGRHRCRYRHHASSVPGLYVAGGLGGHSNGLIGLATYDGKVVADGVLAELPRLATCELPEQQSRERAGTHRAPAVDARSDGVAPAEVKNRIRAMMWEKAGVEKSADGLASALEDIGDIRLDLLPRLGVTRTARATNYEWLDAIDAVNMLDACELIIHSSLERKESRGPFMRRDFPLQDNARWLAANVMKRTENGFRFEQRPYELPFFKPDFVTRNNLEVAW